MNQIVNVSATGVNKQYVERALETAINLVSAKGYFSFSLIIENHGEPKVLISQAESE